MAINEIARLLLFIGAFVGKLQAIACGEQFKANYKEAVKFCIVGRFDATAFEERLIQITLDKNA